VIAEDAGTIDRMLSALDDRSARPDAPPRTHGADEAAAPILAAGSLKQVFQALADARASSGHAVPALRFGASGLLHQRLLAGEPASLYASASALQPQALLAAGQAAWARPFAANTLCLLAAPGFDPTCEDLLPRLLDPATRLGTSTPSADPSGDYAMAMFDRIESSGDGPPGCAQRLRHKALALTGGPHSQRPAGMAEAGSVYAALLMAGQADVMVVYRTNARLACLEQPALHMLELPAAWQVRAEYWLALLKPPHAAALGFADELLGPAGQAVLADHGFIACDELAA
jgi:molybdate transport system substrate-binding protein